MNMVAVADNLCPHVGVFHSRRNHAGVPVVDAGHGVIKVGQVGCTGIEHRLCVVIIGVGVGNGHGAKFAGLRGKLRCTGQLRCDIHNRDQPTAALV